MDELESIRKQYKYVVDKLTYGHYKCKYSDYEYMKFIRELHRRIGMLNLNISLKYGVGINDISNNSIEFIIRKIIENNYKSWEEYVISTLTIAIKEINSFILEHEEKGEKHL